MIYTGYFAKFNKYVEAGLLPISIAGKGPAGINCVEWKFFAPTWDIYSNYKKGNLNEFGYLERFKSEILGVIDIGSLKQFIDNTMINNKKDIILLCYETPDKFCHRHIVADFLEANGYVVKEFQV